MTDEEWIEWIELAPLETDEDWARLAEAFPDSLLAARYHLHVAMEGIEQELIEAVGGWRIYKLFLRLAQWIEAALRFVRRG